MDVAIVKCMNETTRILTGECENIADLALHLFDWNVIVNYDLSYNADKSFVRIEGDKLFLFKIHDNNCDVYDTPELLEKFQKEFFNIKIQKEIVRPHWWSKKTNTQYFIKNSPYILKRTKPVSIETNQFYVHRGVVLTDIEYQQTR